MTKLKRYYWIMGYIKKCKLAWLFSHVAPIGTSFLQAYFGAMSFKNLFLCFEQKSYDYLILAFAFAFLNFVMSSGFGAAFQYLRVKSSAIIKSELKKDLMAKVLVLPLSRVEEEHSGQMLSRFNQDVDVAVSAIDNIMDQIILPAVLGASFLAVVYFTIWELGVFYTVTMLPIIVVGKLFAGRFRKMGELVQRSLGQFNERFSDILAGSAIIKQFSLEKVMWKKGVDSAEQVYSARKSELGLRARYSLSVNIFNHAFVTFPMILGSLLVVAGRAVLPDVMFISRYTYWIRGLVSMLISFTSELQFQLAAADRLREVLDSNEEGFGRELVPFETAGCELSASGVSVAYCGQYVLNRASISARLNEVVAVVGASGSGKSTLLKSIMQFTSYEGLIELFGNDTDKLDYVELRDKIAYVSQDYSLFDGTIYENILYGKPGATEEQVLNAARLSCCDEFAAQLPGKYETQVGEDGSNLSGGQRQRVAIARAVLKDSPVLILDEAMSALDYELENKILAGLRESGRERLIIICTHRLSTIMNASRIYVIDRGEIAQCGTHGELINTEGIYKEFYELQQGGELSA